MAKTRSPTWQPPDYGTCPQCGGSGQWRGIFAGSEGPCAHCHGTGWAAADGEALPLEDLLAMISRDRDHWRQRHQALIATPGVRQAVEAEQERQRQQAQDRAMGYGGTPGTYTGD